MASGLGIAKVVDMKQLRVFATVDELHLPRLKVGAPVEVTFRGSPTVYKGKIAIDPMAVKREKRSEADLGVANVRQIEVEIQADDGVDFPRDAGARGARHLPLTPVDFHVGKPLTACNIFDTRGGVECRHAAKRTGAERGEKPKERKSESSGHRPHGA